MSTPTITPPAPASYRVSVAKAPRAAVGLPQARTRTPSDVNLDSPVRDALAAHADAIARYYRSVFELDAD